MAIGSHQLFLMAADLTVASVLSFVLYVLGCLFLASLSSLVIFHFSFGLLKRAKRRAKRKISLKGRAILSLVSRSTIGGMLVKRLGQEGSGLLEVNRSSEEEKSPMLKKESSSNTRVRQLPAGKEKNQAVMQTLVESPLSWEETPMPKHHKQMPLSLALSIYQEPDPATSL
ncbi:uncharacterized protein LOC118082492 isoform X3 [Zootoca vivipara]|uniref:uncharacterized protein LOC118082492 isoform X3 n=1 Tax=Zootoca vivipara TaxID=8524 RepID=UPI00293BF0BA|nr:uncharacterized protein LOC118082492 isoform X3 [Zootoca vivipara]